MSHLDSTAPRAGREGPGSDGSRHGELVVRFVHPGAPRDVPLTAPTVVGRDERCVVRLAGAGASRQHARFERRGPVWMVEDLQSRNGTFVDGHRLSAGDRVAVEPGTVLRFSDDCAVVVRRPPAGSPGFRELAPGLWGSELLGAAVGPALRAAGDRLSLLICGATGSGKERVARAVHEASRRAGEFVALNCAAVPESLAESELFGARRGAFSGSVRDTDGVVRSAHRGTLLLDEVLDLPPSVQAKLLRAVDVGEVLPVGETRVAEVDVRFIAAVQGSLDEAVARGHFREDLAARLDGLRVVLPALRERREDVFPLFRRALDAFSAGRPPLGLEPEAVEALLLHDWPQNVRELEQCARRAVVTADGPMISRAQLPEKVLAPRGGAAHARAAPSRSGPPRAVSREEVVAILTRANGVVSEAARALGFTRQKTYRLIEEHGIDLAELRP